MTTAVLGCGTAIILALLAVSSRTASATHFCGTIDDWTRPNWPFFWPQEHSRDEEPEGSNWYIVETWSNRTNAHEELQDGYMEDHQVGVDMPAHTTPCQEM